MTRWPLGTSVTVRTGTAIRNLSASGFANQTMLVRDIIARNTSLSIKFQLTEDAHPEGTFHYPGDLHPKVV